MPVIESKIEGNTFENTMTSVIQNGDENVENVENVNLDENVQKQSMTINGGVQG